MQSHGIVLILHADSHLKGNSPTARIFEAAAASCVIISDRHPFIVDEFQDAVLYIDQTLPAEEIYRQIQKHLSWIHSNPREARMLAQKAHQIFRDRFTLENQLKKLEMVYRSQVNSKA